MERDELLESLTPLLLFRGSGDHEDSGGRVLGEHFEDAAGERVDITWKWRGRAKLLRRKLRRCQGREAEFDLTRELSTEEGKSDSAESDETDFGGGHDARRCRRMAHLYMRRMDCDIHARICPFCLPGGGDQTVDGRPDLGAWVEL